MDKSLERGKYGFDITGDKIFDFLKAIRLPAEYTIPSIWN